MILTLNVSGNDFYGYYFHFSSYTEGRLRTPYIFEGTKTVQLHVNGENKLDCIDNLQKLGTRITKTEYAKISLNEVAEELKEKLIKEGV